MSDPTSRVYQSASGDYIAQANEGSHASVTVNHFSLGIESALQAVSGAAALDLPITAFYLMQASLCSEAPLVPVVALQRAHLEDQITKSLSSGCSIVLQGDAGSGRTELARAATEGYGVVYWLDFEANPTLKPEVALTLFVDFVRNRALAQRGEAGSRVLILDNVEQAVLSPAFLAKLKGLAKTELWPLALISLHPLPNSVAPLFQELLVPRLDAADIKRMMVLYGAPRPRLSAVQLVEGVTHGMPDLVTLLLKDWQTKGWPFDDDAWISLLNSHFAQDSRAETQRRLLASEVEGTCELLYRLSLLGRDFSEREAVEIANQMTPVSRAGERLHSVSGRWLHRIRDGRWRTSPLLAKTGENNLPRATQNQVHTTAANWILEKGTLNQLDAQQVILHLVQAERLNQAALILVSVLNSFWHAEPGADPGMLLSLWKGLPLPDGMNLGFRIMIRGLQAAIALRQSDDYSYALSDMLSLIGKSEDPRDKPAIFASAGLVAMQAAFTEPAAALSLIGVAVKSQRQLPTEIRSELKGHAALDIFWAVAMSAKSIAEVDAWMQEVAKLSDTDKQALMRGKFAADSATHMFDQLWWNEQKKLETVRDWPTVTACLMRAKQAADFWDTPLISACVLRSQLAIRLVHLHEVSAPLDEAEAFHNENDDALARFVVSDGTATWLIDIDRWDLAGTWLTRAYAYDGLELPLFRQQTALRYGHLLFRHGAPSIVPFERAISITEQSDMLNHVYLTKARCELATCQWLTKDETGCFQTWSLVAEDLLDSPEDTEQWRHLFALAGSNTAYFMSGSPAETQADRHGVAPPQLGLFIAGSHVLASRYLPALTFLLPGAMSHWAARLGRDRDASSWAQRASDLDQGAERNASSDVHLRNAIPLDIKENRYVDALRHGDLSARGNMSNFYSLLPSERKAEIDMPALEAGQQQLAQSARYSALHVSLLPILMKVLVPVQTDRTAVRQRLEEIAAELRVLSQNSPVAWNIGLDVLEGLLAGNIGMREVQADRPNRNDPEQGMRAVLRSFAIWFSDAEVARDQLLAQANCASYLSGYFKETGRLGMSICEGLANLWMARIQHSPYHFRQPQDTTSRLREAASAGRLGQMFMVLANSLNVSASQEVREQFLGYVL